MEFTHSAAILFLLTERAEQCYKKEEKKLKCFWVSPLKAHKHTVQPLRTFLKLSFDMIEFSYA